MTKTPARPPEIDLKLVAPFIRSVRAVMSTMLKLETTLGPPRLKADPSPEYDCSGIISFSGRIVGTVVVSFQRDAAARMVEAFAGCPIPPENAADFADALGELTNMIAGAAKTELGGDANISIPTVILGRGHQVARPRDIPCLVVPCSTAAGAFAVEIGIKTA